MKEKSLVIILLYMCFLQGHAQEQVYVKGYTIYQYSRGDFWLQNNNRLKCIRSPIPYNFPLQVNKFILMNEKDIDVYMHASAEFKSRLAVFKFSPFYGSVKRYLADSLRIGLIEKENKMESIKTDDVYYLHSNDTLHLYQIRYVEGYAIRIERNNDYLNSYREIDQSMWGIWAINTQIPSFYVYLFYDYVFICPSVIPTGFIKWEPSEQELKQFKKERKYHK